MWKSEALVDGVWVVRAICASKFVASLALANDQLAGREVRLTQV